MGNNTSIKNRGGTINISGSAIGQGNSVSGAGAGPPDDAPPGRAGTPAARQVADIELVVAGASAARSEATLTLTLPGGRPAVTRAQNVAVKLDRAALDAQAIDADRYGRELAAQLFANPALRLAWASARAAADGAEALARLRIALEAAAPEVQSLRWEALFDPETDRPIGLDEGVLLSRFLSSPSLAPIALPPRPALRAAAVIAAPEGMGRYGLSEIDVDGELVRAQRALGGLLAAVVGDGAAHADIPSIAGALRAAPHILYLVCHGRTVDGEPFLCLADEHGAAAWAPAAALVRAIAGLAARPLLAVLVSCQSAGGDGDGALVALAPQLARAGVPAVIGFQGDVAQSTARRLLPPLFAELQSDGVIDRALTVARGHLPAEAWWQPALWLRSRDGRLWTDGA